MMPVVFTSSAMDYVREHLRILSGFYGVLSPFDGVTPYRLEMQAALSVGGSGNLYEFWGDRLYRAVLDEDRTILNLASKEYSKAVEKYLQPEDRLITIVFGELADGRVKQKGTLAKMARGEMVRISRRAALRIWSGLRILPEWAISLRRNIPRGRSGRSCGESGLQPDCDDGRAI